MACRGSRSAGTITWTSRSTWTGSTGQLHPRDEAVLRTFAERYFPDGSGPTTSLQVCAFTNTSDGHFILDAHPEHANVFVASPCSGHGYKFCSVIGEVMADLATTGETPHDIALHGLARFDA